MTETDPAAPVVRAEPSGPRAVLNRPVFVTSAAVTVAVTLWCVIAPDHAFSTLESIVGWVSKWFGWYYVALTTSVLVFVLFVESRGSARCASVRSTPSQSSAQERGRRCCSRPASGPI